MNRAILTIASILICVIASAQTQPDSTKQEQFATVISDSTFNKGNLYNSLFTIKGHVSGLTISKSGGHALVNPSVFIRGVSFFGRNNQPLFVVDGVIGADPYAIAPENIQSFTVLKNAYETAKYGIRGGNGVIEIATKNGGAGRELNVEYHSFISIDQTANRMELLSADQYLSQVQEYANEVHIPLDSFRLNNGSVDWQDEVFQTAITHQQQLALHGIIKNTRYRAFISYRKQPGLMILSENETVGAGISVQQTAFNNRLHFGIKSHFKQLNYSGLHPEDEYDVLYNAYRRSPLDPVYNDDGSYHENSRMFRYINPVHQLHVYEDKTTKKYFINTGFVSYDIFDGLNASVNAGHTFTDSDRQSFFPRMPSYYSNVIQRVLTQYELLQMKARLSFEKEIFQHHDVKVSASYRFMKEDREMGNVTENITDTITFTHELLGYYKRSQAVTARLGYTFKKRYFVSGTIRGDQQKRDYHDDFIEKTFLEDLGEGIIFSTLPENYNEPNNYWSYGVNLGWNIHQESFVKKIKQLNYLQLSLGYGENYSQKNELNRFVLYDLAKYNLPNAITKEWNTQAHFSMFENRAFGKINFYNRQSIAHFKYNPGGFVQEDLNADMVVENSGIEIDLSSVVVEQTNLKWITSMNLYSNRNLVTQFEFHNPIGFGPEHNYPLDDNIVLTSEGEAMYHFYIAQTIGVIDGYWTYLGEDGRPTNDYYRAKKNVVGTILPEWQLGWQNNFYIAGNIDFSFSLRYVYGHSIYNNSRAVLNNVGLPVFNILADEADADILHYSIADLYLEDASYLRIDNITAGYSIDLSKWIEHGKVRFYAGGNNLLTLTKYTGLDPELNYFDENPGIEDPNGYPPIRSVIFGLKLTL
ncbi:MAG: TonB-dependent receptor plug domain-containing protein [Salinivirgaceae bacterium]|nr:TonB-dependent receptor plug domain-containing protein [Salinivirgaceae bacterium]